MKELIVEYDAGLPIDRLITYGIKLSELMGAIDGANNKIKNNLQINRNSLAIREGKLRAHGIAGIVRITDDIELEIMPKFFSDEKKYEWRTTLYLLSALSKHGNLLLDERISASGSTTDSLYDIAARMLAEEYIKNKRKLIRQYRKEQFFDYCIDGDIEFDSIFDNNPNGLKQSRIRFDKVNQYNATIKRAMEIVLPYTSEIKIRNILSNAIAVMGKQKLISNSKLNVPRRNLEWKDAYNLSYDIVRGLGIAFDEGSYYAPGFIADTWRMWEWLITTALVSGCGNKKVVAQKRVYWGNKQSGGKNYDVNVYPDVTVYGESGERPIFLVDAKYKLLENESTGEIDRDDLYEAFAFCKSLDANTIFLVYPIETQNCNPSGTVHQKSKYSIIDTTIYVLTVEFGPMNEKGGIHLFANNLYAGINAIFDSK